MNHSLDAITIGIRTPLPSMEDMIILVISLVVIAIIIKLSFVYKRKQEALQLTECSENESSDLKLTETFREHNS